MTRLRTLQLLSTLCLLPTWTTVTVEAAVTPFVEPDDGRNPLVSALNQSTSSIDIYVFRLTLAGDDAIVIALRNAVSRGVIVQALVEPCPGDSAAVCTPPNPDARAACDMLRQVGAAVKWANPAFTKTHAKSILLDKSRALVLTLNLVPQTFVSRRDYGVLTDDAGVVENLGRVFAQDWQTDDPVTDCALAPGRTADATLQDYTLVIGPDNARDSLIGTAEFPGLILSALSSLKIQVEKVDPQNARGIIPALVDRINAGVQVQVLLKPPTASEPENAESARQINEAGGQARCQTGLHAKMYIADGGQVFVGSHNLTRSSLDRRREIGWITSDSGTRARFEAVFDADWVQAGGCVLPFGASSRTM
jgi:phosphatidylserine/phosphatidylglycerophosphate/cardiolipin synthase-like enzyme